jgi:hypothetical protein
MSRMIKLIYLLIICESGHLYVGPQVCNHLRKYMKSGCPTGPSYVVGTTYSADPRNRNRCLHTWLHLNTKCKGA